MFDRLGDAGLIGLGEAYLAGELDAGELDDDSDELVAVFEVFARHVHELAPRWMQPLRRLGVRRQPPDEVNTPVGSRRNVSRHYDLSNDLFASFLDRTMTYSSALFGPAVDLERGATWDDLAVAQVAKIDRLLDQCAVGEGTRVLEIGTGWGELALRAAARGATVHSVTLSEEQRELASRRILDAGFADRVEVELADYRDVVGQLRRRGERRDGGGRRRGVLAHVLRGDRPSAGAGGPRRDPDHLDRGRPPRCDSPRLHVDPQVRVPGRTGPVDRGHAFRVRTRPASRSSTTSPSAATTPRPCDSGANASS